MGWKKLKKLYDHLSVWITGFKLQIYQPLNLKSILTKDIFYVFLSFKSIKPSSSPCFFSSSHFSKIFVLGVFVTIMIEMLLTDFADDIWSELLIFNNGIKLEKSFRFLRRFKFPDIEWPWNRHNDNFYDWYHKVFYMKYSDVIFLWL